MNRIFCATGIGLFFAGTADARPEWINPLKPMDTVTCGFFDPNYIRTPCKSSAPKDDRNEWRQHLGTDFSASTNQIVYAPVSGTIDCGNAGKSTAAATARAVIRDSTTKEYHVLGHVYCTVASGPVTKGSPVAKVHYQATGTHLHWGFNVKSVSAATAHTSQCLRDDRTKACEWGWGKAPYEATRGEAVNLGWRPVL